MHAPRHSTSSSEKIPSSVVSLWPISCFFERIRRACRAAHAGNVGADLNVIFSSALAAQHGVIRHCLGDLQNIQVEPERDFADHVIADVSELILRVDQHGNQRRSFHRIACCECLELVFELRRQIHQRSISPSTMSSVPMDAITSAIKRPCTIFWSACRFTNDGARNLMR